MNAASQAPEADPRIGARIGGRYRIEWRIALGGMGAVYEGMHEELGRPVAIKVLNPKYVGDAEAVRRFTSEARLASRLEHPNIVAVLDLGQLESGEPYLVMERLEGEDLAELVARESPAALPRVIELLAPVAEALDAVHAAGLVHRDVKPANIVLAKQADGSTVPKLVDFGLAALRVRASTNG